MLCFYNGQPQRAVGAWKFAALTRVVGPKQLMEAEIRKMPKAVAGVDCNATQWFPPTSEPPCVCILGRAGEEIEAPADADLFEIGHSRNSEVLSAQSTTLTSHLGDRTHHLLWLRQVGQEGAVGMHEESEYCACEQQQARQHERHLQLPVLSMMNPVVIGDKKAANEPPTHIRPVAVPLCWARYPWAMTTSGRW